MHVKYHFVIKTAKTIFIIMTFTKEHVHKKKTKILKVY